MPILRGKVAAKFLAEVIENENKPAFMIPTPKLGEAIIAIKKYAEERRINNAQRIR